MTGVVQRLRRCDTEHLEETRSMRTYSVVS